ncbi:MAG: DoxX family protein [Myxococcales bacterium]|nr:DoxX family protein [Myxococcales bacterium]
MHGKRYVDAGTALLRLTLGVNLLLHGISKLRHGIDGIMGMLSSNGLPTFIGYGVYLGEVVAPVMLILGIYSRLAALTMAGNMVFALALAHRAELFALNPQSGAWAVELPMLFLLGSLGVALLGPDRYTLGSRIRGLRG